MFAFRLNSTKDSYPLPEAQGSHLRHLRCDSLPADNSISIFNFAQELIEDLCVHHLDQLPSQPAQLEDSHLHHPAGVVIHGNVLHQTLKLCLCSSALYPDPKTLSCVASNVLYPGNRTGAK